MSRFTRKAAIVTGAASGLGRATALLLAAEGAMVAVADIDFDGAELVRAEIESDGGAAIAHCVDVAEEEAVQPMVRSTVAAFGRLDILHNNAAAVSSSFLVLDSSVTDITKETWNKTMAVNLNGVLFGSKHAIPEFRKAGGGVIVNTASINGHVPNVFRPAYGASKAAVIQLTREVAVAYGRLGIRCNAVSPGFILTPSSISVIGEEQRSMILRHTPSTRLGQAEDIAHAVAFLASDEAAFVNGQVLVVDGGFGSHVPYDADVLSQLETW